ncbi:SCO family protein [Geobacter anodireducens]|uniref:SCO family protein n=1 Tax=Geobacter anodireducens TaxID=1340425 RepID=A0ABR9NW29_9BACT|nr:SCO family protein [Geobacter anodireducens]MBE2888472.1 SCO family protein [Geobacter anodireducens]
MQKINRIIVYTLLLTIAVSGGFVRQAEAGNKKNKKSIESFVVPDAVLTNQNGVKVSLRTLLQTQKPVMLDFIYTACTTTCPVLSATYASIQNRLAPDTQRVQLVSISVDPDHDTPPVLKGYLKAYRAKPGWDFLTGSREEIDKVLKAFSIKEMSYNYFTLIRSSPDSNWIKITGRLDATEVISEYLK